LGLVYMASIPPFEAPSCARRASFRSIEYFLLRMLITTRERIRWKENLYSFARSYSAKVQEEINH
jgi:hypothetical protein